MQKQIENLGFVQGENFEFTVSFKSNGTKYLLTFCNSWEQIDNSNSFVVLVDTADRHRRASTLYIKQAIAVSPKQTWSRG